MQHIKDRTTLLCGVFRIQTSMRVGNVEKLLRVGTYLTGVFNAMGDHCGSFCSGRLLSVDSAFFIPHIIVPVFLYSAFLCSVLSHLLLR